MLPLYGRSKIQVVVKKKFANDSAGDGDCPWLTMAESNVQHNNLLV